jgi:hypothetical protein
MMSQQLLETVGRVLELQGAEIEANEEHLEALMPPALAQALHLPEMAKLYFNPGTAQSDGELITFQSDFLDRLFAMVQASGNCAHLAMPDLYLKKGADEAAEQNFTVLNGLGRSLGSREQRLAYALCNFKYTAVSDEKKEGLAATIINELTLSALPARALDLYLSQAKETLPQSNLERQPFGKVYHAACKSAQASITHELADFHKSLNRRWQRDLKRLQEYYQELLDEIERKIKRRGLEGKELENEQARTRATQLELEKKIADQREKYHMKITVEPVNLLRFELAVRTVSYEARFSKASRELTLVWNPLLKDFESLPCESCSTGLHAFWLCEQKLHVLCAACFRCPQCERKVCRVCHRKQCPKCGAQF